MKCKQENCPIWEEQQEEKISRMRHMFGCARAVGCRGKRCAELLLLVILFRPFTILVMVEVGVAMKFNNTILYIYSAS